MQTVKHDRKLMGFNVDFDGDSPPLMSARARCVFIAHLGLDEIARLRSTELENKDITHAV